MRPIPEDLQVGHYEDEGLRFDRTDRQGNLLTYTTPAHLRSAEHGPWNQAVLAFLLALPPETRVILYGC